MWNMTERQKMISGQLYKSGVKELANDRMLCKEQCYDFNALRPSQTEQQSAMIKKIFGKVGANCFITAPFWCDYGYNIEAGDNFYANHNLVILDCAKVTFGNNVFIAPDCGFYTAGHPVDAASRNEGWEYAYPINVGSDAWQLMRSLSFSPWRVTGSEFIQGYQAGTDSFSDNESAKYAVNLLSDLGTKGYFEPGFASVDFTSACNLFFGGSGAIFYTGSGQISLAEEMYDNGELGFFPVPDTEGMDNMSTNIPVHAGFAEGFNKATYDDTMQEFFDYMCENFTDACYNQAQVFSPFNEELPEGLPQLYYDTQPMFEDAETAWTSWDDKLDSDVMTKIVDEQQQLAQGIIKPDEFIKTCDSLVKK